MITNDNINYCHEYGFGQITILVIKILLILLICLDK